MSATQRLVVALLVTALSGTALGCAQGGVGEGPAGSATVTSIIDGDTIVVDIAGQEHRVRLLGVDTPETVHPARPVECFGPEAAERLSELTPPGSTLRLERDLELRDAYGRLLAYLFTEDGTFVNLVLVEEGYAEAMQIPPNTARTGEIADAERQARREGRGLWSACPGQHDHTSTPADTVGG